METILLELVTLNDVEDLKKIGRRTFLETFSAENSEEDMQKYLEENFASGKLTRELKEQDSDFYFAKKEGKILGYLKVNWGNAQTEHQDLEALEIERIYVLKEYQGEKVGQLLYNKALKLARKKNVSYIWLGVWEENHRAINFYKKNGFEEFGKHIFKLGNDEQVDLLMKKDLSGEC